MKVSRFVLTAALAALINGSSAFAHLTYGGRDFGTLVEGTAATTIATQTLSSSFGWADATDSDWGDSHRGRFFRFTLTGTTSVSITAQRNTNAAATGATGVLLPGISLFSGLGTVAPEQPGHDGSDLSIASRPGTTYDLQVSTDLQTWTNIEVRRFIEGTGATLELSDPLADRPRVFYRLVEYL